MINTVVIVLVVLWLLGLVGKIGGNLIHTLLVIALIVFIWNMMTHRNHS